MTATLLHAAALFLVDHLLRQAPAFCRMSFVTLFSIISTEPKGLKMINVLQLQLLNYFFAVLLFPEPATFSVQPLSSARSPGGTEKL